MTIEHGKLLISKDEFKDIIMEGSSSTCQTPLQDEVSEPCRDEDEPVNEGEIELTKKGKVSRPKDPNIQDVRLPLERDIAEDAKKMGKMIRRGRVSLFLEYIREGLQKSIIEEQEILKAKGFVPTCNLLVNTVATASSNNKLSQVTKTESEVQDQSE